MKTSIIISMITSVATCCLTSQGAVGTLTGPFAHRNLQVFLVHGDAELDNRDYMILSEAMAKGLVMVKETGNVNELTIENLSPKLTVFLNAGDIVKGGRQDRTVTEDLILPPHFGTVGLATFCVEHGRWTKRGDENAAAFSSNTRVLSSKDLKMAARYGLNQSEVWSKVAEQQTQLNENVSRLSGKRVDTRSSASTSSYQLTLENKDLEDLKRAYLDDLGGIIKNERDVIGFVYVINGEINSAEIYNNRNLFRAWPKLIDSAITEAIAEHRSDKPSQTPDAAELKHFFETAVSGTARERQVCKTTRVKTYTSSTTVLFETIDVEHNAWLHKSFIFKGKQSIKVPLDNESSYYPEQQRQRLAR